MSHRSIFLLSVFLLSGTSGFSQIMIGGPGIGFPGGGYPGRRYPQGQQPGNNGQTTDPSASTLTGILRKINDTSVVLEDDDRNLSTITIANSTKYVDDTGKSAHIGDFQPGDRVTIGRKKEKDGSSRAQKITMVRVGTTEEHAAASQAEDDLSHPLQKGDSASNSSSGSNGPKLRRASDSDSSASSSSSPGDNDPDRPILRRAASSSSSSASNNSSSNSSSGDDDPDRPILRRADSSSAGTSSGSSSESRASSAGASPTPDDDPDRPILRRSNPNSSGSSSSSSSSSSSPYGNSSETVASAERPSLHAEDSNGVTRTPPPPQIAPVGSGAPVTASDPHVYRRTNSSGDEVIDSARNAAFSFTETLPNYVVKQYTMRYETDVAHGRKTSWNTLDNVTADIIEENGVEKYRNILVNGKPPREDVEKTGSWSSGEFSSLQLDVLSPSTNADFHGKRTSTIVNRPAYRYDFSVEQANSHWHVESESQTIMPSYTGSIWIDKQTSRVLRIELAAGDMPRSFPLDTVESAVDYDFVLIGEGKYLLPVHSEALSCVRGTSQCSRNVIEFRNYRKFSADTSITFDTDNK